MLPLPSYKRKIFLPYLKATNSLNMVQLLSVLDFQICTANVYVSPKLPQIPLYFVLHTRWYPCGGVYMQPVGTTCTDRSHSILSACHHRIPSRIIRTMRPANAICGVMPG